MFLTGLAAVIALFPLALHAGQLPERPRPKIGLALGGGSAPGLSHLGVLKWLEEHRIPVDYVAGTSMGGLVGALYATGHRPAEIEEFVRQIDWEDALRIGLAYHHLSYRRREDLRQFPNRLEIGVKHGMQLPAGLSAGHTVGLVLSRFTSPYAGLRTFDDLPIPFRTVAANLINGEQVVFDRGSLFDALRSTMALPGAITPWKTGGMVLVDGGVLNNLPVDVVKKMGADVVIAVVMEKPPASGKELESILGITGRAIDVMIANEEKRSMALADLVVAPDLKGVGSNDYQRAPELAQRGYDGAAKKAFFLEKLSIAPQLWEEHLRKRAARRRGETWAPKFVEVKGAAPGKDRKLREDLQNLAGAPLDRQRVERRLNHIVGEGRYASAHYDFDRPGDETGLVVHFQEKAHAPPILNTLLVIDGASSQPFRFGAASRLTFLDVGGPGSEWRTDLSIGGFNQILSEYYWRVGGSRFFLAPRGFVQLTSVDLYDRGARLATLDAKERGFGVDAGFAASQLTEIRVGYEWNQVRTSVATGAIRPPLLNGNFSSVRAKLVYDGQDSASVPRKGFRATSQFQWVMDSPTIGKEGYAVFQGVLSYAKPVTARIHLTSSLEGGTKGNRAELYPPFALGGVLRLSALARQQLTGNRYYLGGVGAFHSLTQTIPRFGKLYAGGLYELGNAWQDGQPAKPYHSGAIGILGETLVGVMFLGGSVGDKGERKVFFRLGRIF